ncbi:hypothetical protein XBKQ1_2820033 [Xenorhabdus bovienii str. kraussei Quebec]|uniref:Uncharacterized protein n=4 Tax=Xenorhabdus bovienii TaxID=40576 RepID=A0A077PMC0_XENBV|nr:hypothetical protein XBFFR1_2570003 [Xenorhabdus bovienii str. feltiae France]CDG93716.1 hypothetical protein XBFFL1_2670003 [Xenorhabdus bovienii str. feltiae Florida]CDG97416.1 hypothetical protein XBP1_2630006 [Xenorhabdus bovienii str. puntauvense]CDH00809.1 hypothetical protein XBFM1_1900003 [Xenorhabdus bovienii str. feltiae Moldova]CDH20909.1 hypothetical protein XBKQ1_2820033 [Xenorhabdus bovienii str. kraussei Quebec]CDM88761.1 protein of unknown function [Xenorhabdus bovienii]
MQLWLHIMTRPSSLLFGQLNQMGEILSRITPITKNNFPTEKVT